jgi:hypothetical protein
LARPDDSTKLSGTVLTNRVSMTCTGPGFVRYGSTKHSAKRHSLGWLLAPVQAGPAASWRYPAVPGDACFHLT